MTTFHRVAQPIAATLFALLVLAIPLGYLWMSLPLILVAIALLPPTFGFISGFRFRLGHFFAYTALIAAELAFWIAYTQGVFRR